MTKVKRIGMLSKIMMKFNHWPEWNQLQPKLPWIINILLSTGKNHKYPKVRFSRATKFSFKVKMENFMKALIANLLNLKNRVKFLWQILLRSPTIFSVEIILLSKLSLTTANGHSFRSLILSGQPSKSNPKRMVKNFKSVLKPAKMF